MGMSMEDLSAEVRKNAAAMASYQKQSASALGPSGVEQWVSGLLGQSAAAKKLQTQLAESAASVRRLQDALSENPSTALIQSAERALSIHKELGEENLSGLKSAIDAAKQKMESLNSSAKSTLSSLQDQWDQLNGNELSQENRRYTTETADLESQLADARAASNQQAVRDLQQSLELSRKIHSQKISTIQAEQDAAKTVNQQTTQSSSGTSTTSNQAATTRVIELKLPNGAATIKTDAAGEAALDQLLSQLESASQISIS